MEINDKLREFIRKELIPVNQQTEAEQDLFMKNAGLMELPEGKCLFQAGASDDYTYYLVVGKLDMQSKEGADIKIDSNTEQAKYPLAQVQPRKYTAVAITPAWILRIESKFVNTPANSVSHAKPESDEVESDWMTKLLESHIFSNIPVENFQRIFTLFEQLSVKQGETIIQQGEAGDYYYIIDKGQFQVKQIADGKENILAEMDSGDGFGEEALIGDTKRNATVTATSDGELIRIKKEDFLTLVRDPAVKSVSFEETRELVKQGAICIDARFNQEYMESPVRLKGSINIPINRLRTEADNLDRQKSYIVYCDTGARSAIEAFLLLERGFNVCHLTGGIAPFISEQGEKEEEKEDLDKLVTTSSNEQTEIAEDSFKSSEDSQPQDEKKNTTESNAFEEDILSKLKIAHSGDMGELSKVLGVVLSNVYTQLETALKEKAEAEIAKRIAEEKLQQMIDEKNKS